MKPKLKIVLALCFLIFSLQSPAQVGAVVKGAFSLLKLATNSKIIVQLRNAAGMAIGAAFATTDAWKQTFAQISDTVGSVVVSLGDEFYEVVVKDSLPTYVVDDAGVAWAQARCLEVVALPSCTLILSTINDQVANVIAEDSPNLSYWQELADNSCAPVTTPRQGFTGQTVTKVSPGFLGYSGASKCIDAAHTNVAIPSIYNNISGSAGSYSVLSVLPADGKKRLINSSGSWVADPADLDWRGVTPPVPASTVRLQTSNDGSPSVLDVTAGDSTVALKEVTTTIDPATNKTVSTVDDAVINTAGQVVSSTSNTYINVDPASLLASGAGAGSTTFPDHMNVTVQNPVTIANLDGLVVNTTPDQATQTWMYNLKADTSDIRTNTKKVADGFDLASSPSLPDADDIKQYLFPAVFGDLLSYRPQFTVTCSPLVIDTGFFPRPLTMNAHCTLLDSAGPMLRSIVSGAWLIAALFIVLSA